jgi:chromate transporter
MSQDASNGRLCEVFTTFLKLGLTSFGGPIAHLGYFRNELVIRREWLDETTYADLIALCRFLPGSASSQVGFSLGVLRGNGLFGGLVAWLAFTMPSALIPFAFDGCVRARRAGGRGIPARPAGAGVLSGLT